MTININDILKALANDKRLLILQWLKNPGDHFTSDKCDVNTQGVCVGLIEKKIGLSQSTVSQYLLQLQRADLITMERVGQWTFCKLNQNTVTELIQELKTRL